MPRTKQAPEVRFWGKVDQSDGPDACWEWQGARGKNGYGRLRGETGYIYAHRLSFELHYGAIPEGLIICHTCDNRACCNPAQLFAGTYRDNVQDAIAKGRFHGHRPTDPPTAVKEKSQERRCLFSDAQVLDILAQHSSGMSARAISRALKVTNRTIEHILKGKRYRWIPQVAALAQQ